jgi:hypothetical protein
MKKSNFFDEFVLKSLHLQWLNSKPFFLFENWSIFDNFSHNWVLTNDYILLTTFCFRIGPIFTSNNSISVKCLHTVSGFSRLPVPSSAVVMVAQFAFAQSKQQKLILNFKFVCQKVINMTKNGALELSKRASEHHFDNFYSICSKDILDLADLTNFLWPCSVKCLFVCLWSVKNRQVIDPKSTSINFFKGKTKCISRDVI